MNPMPVPPPNRPSQPVPPPWQAMQQAWAQAIAHAKRAYSRIGLGITVTIGIWLTLTTALQRLVPMWMGTPMLSSWIALVINDVVLYCVAIPIGYAILGTAPVQPTRRYRLSVGRFLVLLLMCVPLMYGGSIVGNLIASEFGTAANRIEDMVGGTSIGEWLISTVAVVVLAPLMEEWLFRKQVISRLRRYGERPALLVSALLFALFHVNMYQFFYAFALGLMFGYVYLRTSALRYSVAMHMTVNAVGGVVAPWVLERAQASGALGAAETGDLTGAQAGALLGLVAFALLLLAAFVAGLVLLIVQRKRFVFYPAPVELPRGSMGGVVFGNVGMVLFLVIGIAGTVLSVL